MPLSFITITKEDEPFLKEMLYEALYIRTGQLPFEPSIVDEPSFKKYYTEWSLNKDIGIILSLNNQQIGACWSRTFTKEKPSYGFIDEKIPEITIALKKQFHNQGFGTKLLLELFKRNKRAGFNELSLSVDQESPALRLYKRLGFELYQTEGTAFTMIKKL